MRKAILVMDMPKNCFDCRFQEMGFCEAVHSVGEMITDDDLESKPDWCTLREMPEKLPLQGDVSDLQKMLEEMRRASWNACIDAIGGGDN